jgi:hypothetical protein
VSIGVVPADPDVLDDPKQALVNLARASRKARIREMFVPKIGVSSVVGRGYVEGFAEFIGSSWSLDSAIQNSASLARFVDRAREIYLPN